MLFAKNFYLTSKDKAVVFSARQAFSPEPPAASKPSEPNLLVTSARLRLFI